MIKAPKTKGKYPTNWEERVSTEFDYGDHMKEEAEFLHLDGNIMDEKSLKLFIKEVLRVEKIRLANKIIQFMKDEIK